MKILSLLRGNRPPILLLFLIWNLGASLVSHATEATPAAWRTIDSRIAKLLFVVANFVIFPYLALWLIPEDVTLLIFLHVILLAKVILYLGGQFGKGAKAS